MIDLTLLDPDFQRIVPTFIHTMVNKGYTIVPDSGLRSVQQQAILWRQSRPTSIINEQIECFHENGCDYLADVLDGVGYQNGKWATNALPGYSWHNWGQAIDCLIVPGTRDDYKIYADTAVSLGLTAGYYFTHQDMDHIQLNAHEIPTLYTMKQINDHFQALALSS